MDELNLRRVRYFVRVAEELHFGRAAEDLFISQPSLSQQIRRLEDQVGAELLSRTSRRVVLTDAGARFLREARGLLAQAERTLSSVRPDDRLGVGFTGSAAVALLGSVMHAFSARRPQVRVTVRDLGVGHVEEIARGTIDVAFTRLLPGEADLEIAVLAREARVVALPSTHRLAARPAIAFSDLGDEDFIASRERWNPSGRSILLAEHERHGLPGSIGAEVDSVEELLTLVAAKQGVAVLPASTRGLFPRPGVSYVEVRDADPSSISLAWRRGDVGETLGTFIEESRQVARRLFQADSGGAHGARAAAI